MNGGLFWAVNAAARRWAAFSVLVLLASARWVFVSNTAGPAPALESEVVGLATACAMWLALELIRRLPGSRDVLAPVDTWRCVLAGASIFGGPAIAMLGLQHLSAVGFTTAMTLTPVVAGVAISYLRPDISSPIAHWIWPGLAAMAGLLMLFSTPSLQDVETDIAYVLAPVLTGAGAALFWSGKAGKGCRATPALAGGVAVLTLLLVICFLRGYPLERLPLVSSAIDGAMATLALASLEQLGAQRWSAQFVLVPLLVVLQGMVLSHSAMGIRGLFAVGLLSIAASSLLRRADDPDALFRRLNID
jgi:drug/metabolite transporter (DMT)-like permease